MRISTRLRAAVAVPAIAVIGVLGGCGDTPPDSAAPSGDPASSSAPPATEAADASAFSDEEREQLAYEYGVEVEDLENLSDEELQELADLPDSEKEELATMLGYPEWGETVTSDDGQYEYTVSKPKEAQVQSWDADPESDETEDGVKFEVTFTNKSSASACVCDSTFSVFSGLSEGVEALKPGAIGTEDPTDVPPGRTAKWTDYYIVEVPNDTTVSIDPPSMEDGSPQSEILYGVSMSLEEMSKQ